MLLEVRSSCLWAWCLKINDVLLNCTDLIRERLWCLLFCKTPSSHVCNCAKKDIITGVSSEYRNSRSEVIGKKLFLARDYIAKFTPHFPHVLRVGNTLMDLVLFTTRVPGTSDTSATRVTRMRQECDTSNTSATRVPDTNDTSATRVKNFDFVTTRVKIYFHTLYLLYGKWKSIRRETISFWDLLFGNVYFPCQNAFKKCITKTKLFNEKSYIKKFYTRL